MKSMFLCVWNGTGIEEGRAASESPHETFGYFLSIFQQEDSVDIIQNSAVGNFSSKTEGTKTAEIETGMAEKVQLGKTRFGLEK
jgi:hypothetical protein